MMEKETTQRFYSHGKLLLTAEYLVMEGARALAIPTCFGQWMEVRQITSVNPEIHWKSNDHEGNCWLDVTLDANLQIISSRIAGKTDLLLKLLQETRRMNPSFLSGAFGWEITSQLEFPNDWGLGSSSTLVNNVASWAGVDAFQLQFSVFGGSGYDIACAQHSHPIIYQLVDQEPVVEEVDFSLPFSDQLFFVYLGEKQNSRNEIERYQKFAANKKGQVNTINALTEGFIECQTMDEMKKLLVEHEQIISEQIGMATIKEQRFSDYSGVIKSLGAWGGDFVLSLGGKQEREYFTRKGHTTLLEFDEMILPH